MRVFRPMNCGQVTIRAGTITVVVFAIWMALTRANLDRYDSPFQRTAAAWFTLFYFYTVGLVLFVTRGSRSS